MELIQILAQSILVVFLLIVLVLAVIALVSLIAVLLGKGNASVDVKMGEEDEKEKGE